MVSDPHTQLTRADLAELSPDDIAQAYAEGRLNVLLRRPVSVSEAISGLPQPEGASER